MNSQLEQISGGAQELKASGTEMTESVGSIKAVVEQTMAATEQMQATSGTVKEAVANIASISEENSAATQESSASAEEMSAQVEQVTSATHSLLQISGVLSEQMQTFNLDVTVDDLTAAANGTGAAGTSNGNGKATVEEAAQAAPKAEAQAVGVNGH